MVKLVRAGRSPEKLAHELEPPYAPAHLRCAVHSCRADRQGPSYRPQARSAADVARRYADLNILPAEPTPQLFQRDVPPRFSRSA
jgi:hypothetical protein